MRKRAMSCLATDALWVAWTAWRRAFSFRECPSNRLNPHVSGATAQNKATLVKTDSKPRARRLAATRGAAFAAAPTREGPYPGAAVRVAVLFLAWFDCLIVMYGALIALL